MAGRGKRRLLLVEKLERLQDRAFKYVEALVTGDESIKINQTRLSGCWKILELAMQRETIKGRAKGYADMVHEIQRRQKGAVNGEGQENQEANGEGIREGEG